MNNKISLALHKIFIVLVLFGQFCAQGFYFPVISSFPAYLILLIVLDFFSICYFLINATFSLKNSLSREILILFVLLFLDIVFVCLFNNVFDLSRIGLIFFSFLFVVPCFNVANSKNGMQFLLKTFVFIVLISSITEIGQFFKISFFSDIWKFLHVDDMITNATNSERYLGLANSSLAFAYNVSTAFVVSFFVKFKKNNLIKRILLIIVFSFSILTNNTRSAFVAIAFFLALMVFAKKQPGKRKNNLLRLLSIFAVLCLVAFTFLFGDWLSNTRFANLAESADTISRMPMLLTALNTMLHHPFGVGNYIVDPELIIGSSTSTYSFVLNNTAHNLIGNCAANYGVFGLVLMVLIYINCYRVFKRIKSTSFNYNYGFCAFSCLIVLSTNAFFHNLYILNGEIGSFLFIGLLLAVYRDNFKENNDAIFVRGSTFSPKSISNY